MEVPTCGRVCDDHMREARLIQGSLLPTASLRDRGIEIAFRFTPYFEVGGDFVDFFRLPDGLIGLYIGDVVGKGLPATMYGALVIGILRGIHKSDIDTGMVLSLLNQRLRQRPLPGRSCATLYAVFDPSTRTLAFFQRWTAFSSPRFRHRMPTRWRGRTPFRARFMCDLRPTHYSTLARRHGPIRYRRPV